ncbi:protein trichome birefringence-like 14 isoform X1 [Camellia sinensis]|uniref:protein trichome birefringence-like 14 isoform X1 n=1 Tax=Camellia sinensis TaxID=4442 RepID=UPI00103691C8|nr:protein trichome birefringence-like 14 isoform X1 [Camellia sinensis]
MKAIFYGLRNNHVYLILITLVCGTVVLWAWEKTPFLTTILPPQDHVMRLSAVIPDDKIEEKQVSVGGDISEQSEKVIPDDKIKEKQVSVGENISDQLEKDDKIKEQQVSVGENILEQSEKGVDIAVVNATNTSSSAVEEGNTNLTTLLDKEHEISPSTKEVSDVEQVSKQKNSSKQGEKKNLVAPSSSVRTDSSVRGEDNNNLMSHVEKQACSYAKGKWVTDDSRPLYSGFGCKQWLSSMWSCRLTQRQDFQYEKLRWQPKDCKMEDFTGSKFLSRMKDKTLAFVGDSLGRQQFQSVMCMVTGGEQRTDVLNVGEEYGLVKGRGAIRPGGWAYRFPNTNTTVLYYWSASLCDLVPLDITNLSTDVAMHLDRPPAFLRHYLHKFDVLVLNTGHHWNRGKLNANRWVMYVGGVPNTDRKIAGIPGARNLTVHSIIKWVNSQLLRYPGLKAFYRSISPRHFFNGDWDTGGTCENTSANAAGMEVLQEESSDDLAARAVKGTSVKLLDITALSQLRDEGHISRYSIKATPGAQDCLHWCLPGVPDTWNEILFAQL